MKDEKAYKKDELIFRQFFYNSLIIEYKFNFDYKNK
jgi:hypothetical protein